VASAVRSCGSTAPANPAPKLGADTDDLLRDAGYTNDDIAALRDKKVI